MKKVLLFVFLLFLIIITTVLIKVSFLVDENEQKKVYNKLDLLLQKELKYKKDEALALALAFSKNSNIIDALIEEDEDKGFNVLSENIKTLTTYLKKENIYAQILTKDLIIFARSWDSMFSGMPLDEYRDDLKELVANKKAKVEIEVGRLLSIKASAPIIDDRLNFLGTVEVITLLDELVEKLRGYKIELIPLMDKKYLKSAYFMELNKLLFNKYILINKNYNYASINFLESLNDKEFNKLMNNDILYKRGFFMSAVDMYNNKGSKLGKFLIMIEKDTYEEFKDSKSSFIENIININSTQDDIYNYIKSSENNIFENFDAKSIANLRSIIDNKDMLDYKNIARTKLQRLSKKELVDIILDETHQKEINGEIR